MQVTIYKVYEGDNTKQCVSPSSFYLTVILFHLSIIFHTHTERCILLLLFVHLFVVILPFKYLFLWLYFCFPRLCGSRWEGIILMTILQYDSSCLGKFTDCHKLIALLHKLWNQLQCSIDRRDVYKRQAICFQAVCQKAVPSDPAR